MKLIETPVDIAGLAMKVIIFRWNTGDGEIYIELTPTNEGIEVYCDGEGLADLDLEQDTINAMTIKPRLLI